LEVDNIKKEDIQKFVEAYGIKTTEDIHEAIKDLFGKTLENILDKELEINLGYAKHDYSNKETDNSRNGYSQKTVNTNHGPMRIQIPRDRRGEFDPVIIKKNQRDISTIEEQIIAMYACGMSTRDISEHLKSIYGTEMSPEKISQITDSLLPIIAEWRNRALDRFYPVVFIDGMYFKLNDNHSVKKRALYLIIGINAEGQKEVLGMWIDTSESAKGWLDILNDIKNRGVQRICFVCADGLTGLDKAVYAVYPESKLQRCIVHQVRNTLRFVSYKDRKKMANDMKAIYRSDTKEIAEQNLKTFEETWSYKYPNSVRSWIDNWEDLTTFFVYPKELRTLIYTTNPIESVNRQIRKITKTKGHFPTENSIFKLVYLGLQNASRSWTMRMLHWDQIMGQLVIYFEDLKAFV